MGVEEYAAMSKHFFTEPRFVAQVQWMSEFGLGAQLAAQVPREEQETYVATRHWPEPDRRVSLVEHEEPDWAWWEPRYDQPWRRQAARNREFWDGR